MTGRAPRLDAMILAGGRGERLRPVTDYVPKPLVPLANVPMLEWQVRHLRRHGIRRIVVCAGYRAAQIENYVDARGMGRDVVVSVEASPLGTGGAMRRAEALVRGPSAIVMNGDVITDIGIRALARVPDTLAAVPLRTQYGVLEPDGELVSEFREKGEVAGLWMNAGIYHLSRATLRAMPRKGDAERTVFARMAARGRLRMERFAGARWHSVDSHRDLAEASAGVEAIMGPRGGA
ncbi:MAG: nucleotidyltransferase family protein [Thaumarchaeota archaeon]|nr:nucleotidyltransferase family protein [Nitrososphaerota archaeon]